jgi:hypothetical protein
MGERTHVYHMDIPETGHGEVLEDFAAQSTRATVTFFRQETACETWIKEILT